MSYCLCVGLCHCLVHVATFTHSSNARVVVEDGPGSSFILIFTCTIWAQLQVFQVADFKISLISLIVTQLRPPDDTGTLCVQMRNVWCILTRTQALAQTFLVVIKRWWVHRAHPNTSAVNGLTDNKGSSKCPLRVFPGRLLRFGCGTFSREEVEDQIDSFSASELAFVSQWIVGQHAQLRHACLVCNTAARARCVTSL